MTSPFDLTGSLAVVTGASRGIGAGIALGLAEAGADVVGVARGSQDATAAAVREAGRDYTALAADLSSPDGVRGLVASLDALDRPIDILVNNAGIAERNPAEHHTDEQWAAVLDVNLTAPFVLARELGARMLDRGSGRIVFLGSMMTWQGGRDVVSYTASKSAVAGLVHALANEWAGRGVGVNAIAPGYIETELTSATHGDPARRAAFEARIPAGRWGSAADVAGAVVFLASPAAAYVHGVVLPVDGGWLVR
ncbi:SDR family oxidoreductase [Salinibacterium soli]|uniref:SDR family oxidoreductase n=1 Tax=Antiquaquibacter soli TaxID=3064523 RepID=A0ABT9BMN5_9MICO|nr:SDR family oxidoreductase [Protaetiibacter sp. WY-16]MDO7880675.1 SDR family oxidoreductase [Protaetiibacter sp. WY-16]